MRVVCSNLVALNLLDIDVREQAVIEKSSVKNQLQNLAWSSLSYPLSAGGAGCSFSASKMVFNPLDESMSCNLSVSGKCAEIVLAVDIALCLFELAWLPEQRWK